MNSSNHELRTSFDELRMSGVIARPERSAPAV
jgi:hypothetical protein